MRDPRILRCHLLLPVGALEERHQPGIVWDGSIMLGLVVNFLAEPYREQCIPSLLPEKEGEEGFIVAAIPHGYSRGNLAPNVSNVLIGDEGNERRLQWNLY